ncbi:MAG TPA: MBL fold metallo-hydrolase [Vicinamibacterales bacterium]|jgi:metallo-beta-lactamase class B|nr:MBL fold metallo-hydrolase [Vicinamibacterales bacterium]
MNKHIAGIIVSMTCALGAASLQAQGPPPGAVATSYPAVPAEAQKHIEAARTAADGDWKRLFEWVCTGAVQLATPPVRRGGGGRAGAAGGGRRGGGPPAPPARETWHAEPQQVFDNLYFVGMTEYSAWAITTSKGIILLDAIFDYSIQDEVDDGLRKVGLNPADIKYVVVSHGHLDHAGGAKYLQDKYGARLVMSAADYDFIDQQNPTWKPKRDIVATDGMTLTLGDETMTLYLTPGHTEGTISTIFPVRDGGTRHVVATWGGTLFNFGPNRPRLQSYADQAVRFRDIATKAKADVIMANHTEYDGSKTKLPAVAERKKGNKHPYVVGTDAVRRYLTTVNECAQAALVIVPPAH